MTTRLNAAVSAGHIDVSDGSIGVFGPKATEDLSDFQKSAATLIQGFAPDAEAWSARGYNTVVRPEGPFEQSVVVLPRARDAIMGRIAEAAALTRGTVIVDGLKV